MGKNNTSISKEYIIISLKKLNEFKRINNKQNLSKNVIKRLEKFLEPMYVCVVFVMSCSRTGHQCCQLSNFVVKFCNFSDYPSNFFFQKHLATNLAIFFLASFSNVLISDSNDKKEHLPFKLHKQRKPKMPRSTELSYLLFAIVYCNNNNKKIIV